MKIIYLFFLLTFVSCSSNFDKQEYILWYNKPAKNFEESLVLGNGKMGATVYGGATRDSIFLNDLTLWSGEPVNPNVKPNKDANIEEIRRVLFNEDYEAADELNKNIEGQFSQSYAPLGQLYIDFDHGDVIKDYYRELNISNATSKISYQVNGTIFQREYFVSNPNQMLVIKLRSSKPSSFSMSFGSQLKYTSSIIDSKIESNGYAPYHAEPSYRGEMEDAVLFDPERGTRFTNLIQVKDSDGSIVIKNGQLTVVNATETILLVTVATSFNGFDKDPVKEGRDNNSLAKSALKLADELSYDDLLQKHTVDYHSFFDRLQFSLNSPSNDIPTDERLLAYANNAQDPGLEELYFHFGRYLLISSSRTPEVPANLQGLWNHYMRPPWSSNYTVNINVEENYWLAETANLSELHVPLLQYINNVSKTGKNTAHSFYNVEKGWCVGHNSDIWALSNPVGDFGQGSPNWACWNMGGAWLATHLWEHYAFTKDETFLANSAYPLMKGAAEFCNEWLIEGPNGELLTAPSTSPENTFVTNKGYVGSTLYGATADLAIMRELFNQTIRASEILNIDENYRNELKESLKNMHPYQIGKNGNLQEWYFDWEDEDPKHRHQTHLFGLHPGHHITPTTTPELAKACEVVLNVKGDETTGWSKGWRINLWARLKDGNRAYKLYRELLRYVDPSGIRTEFSKGGGTYPNLLDAHPPFQIDGNFGGAAGVLEMLVQSTEKNIEILPALPDVWHTGSLHGVKTRGGFELNLDWENGILKNCEISNASGGVTNVIYRGKSKKVELKKGEKVSVNWD